MAAPNPVLSTDLASQLATLFKNEIQNVINRACPEAAFLRAEPGTGKNVQWDVRTGDAIPGTPTQAEGADVATYRNDVYVPAVLQFANFFEPFAITEKSIMAAAAAGNPAALMNQVRRQVMDAAERLASNFGNQFYVGAGTTNNLHGLYAAGAEAIGDTGIYAGIDPVSFPQWVGNVHDAGGADIGVPVLRALRKKIRDARGVDPDLYICDTTQFDKLAAEFDTLRRYVETVTTFTRADGATITIDGGVKFLSFEGARIIWSRLHPAQKITALSTRYIHVEQLPDAPDSPGEKISFAGTPDDQGLGAAPFQLTARIKRLAEAGDARKFSMFMYPQLVVDARNAHGYATNLSA